MLCFVDDGSTDDTFKITSELESKYSDRVCAISCEQNVGKAQFATDRDLHLLEDAIVDADIFLGLSAGNVMTPEMFEKEVKKGKRVKPIVIGGIALFILLITFLILYFTGVLYF